MKRIFVLFWITAVVLILVVFGSTVTADKTKYNNDFVRIFPSHFVNSRAMLKVGKGRFSLAGLVNEKIYLRDRSSRSGLLVADGELRDTTFVSVPIPKGFEVIIDSPWFFLYNGYLPVIQRGNISSWSIDTTFSLLSGFTLMQPISKNTAILRTVDLQKRKSMFVQSNSSEPPKDILEKQVDGILCTDGFFQYSKEYHQLVYTYRYRNEFLCLDTMLNIQLAGKTIDTTTVAKISVAEVDGEIKMSKPPLTVNKSICVDGKYLFVYSNLTARNESIDQSKKNSTIDVYVILDGHYICSFYIENIAGTKMLSFRIHKSTLVAIFPEYIAQYNLNPRYLSF